MITGINATGTIDRERYGQFSLAFFGEKTVHHKVNVQIRGREGPERVYVSGFPANDDFDMTNEESFFVELAVSPDRMQLILTELQQLGAVMKIRVSMARFRGFYASWSPSISEGRLIKFLDRQEDVENHADIPEDFLKSYLAFEDDDQEFIDHPVQITFGRHLSEAPIKPTDEEPDEYLDEPLVPQQPNQSARNPDVAIMAAARLVKRGLTMLSAAVVVAAVLVALS